MAPSRWRREVASDWEWFHVHACNRRIALRGWHKAVGDYINGQGVQHDTLGTYLYLELAIGGVGNGS